MEKIKGFSHLPTTPGIYRFYNSEDQLIYVGKAKNLHRRLSQYKNAKRRKAHEKMRKIVKEAKRLEIETCENEFQALALENRWIQDHRPKWNVAGAFFFLYPMVGLCRKEDGYLYLCYTTSPEHFPNFQFHGAFRSRMRTRDGFFALTELLRFIGHPVAKNHLLKSGICPPPIKHSYVYGFRQVPTEWQNQLEAFFRGEDFGAIEELSLLLLDRPTAVAQSKETQERLRTLRGFWRHELTVLKRAREKVQWKTYPIAQKERDLLFIKLKSGGTLI